MKIGDRVKFLSEKGGGKIVAFQGSSIALVEDEDGFQIPFQTSELVVVTQENYDRNPIMKSKVRDHAERTVVDSRQIDEKSDGQQSQKKEIFERTDGDKLSCFLAFVPLDEKNIGSTSFECYLVNDCNYELAVVTSVSEGSRWKLFSYEIVEPNTKSFIRELSHEETNAFEQMSVQLLAYKTHKPYLTKLPVEARFRIDPIKFFKLHSFKENDFFEQPAYILTIIENDRQPTYTKIDPLQLKASMYADPSEGTDAPSVKTTKKGNTKDDTVVVDLHADKLLDSFTGMDNAAILELQIKKFKEVLEQYAGHPGQRIVFIHGKGEGVLRRSIINELRYRYKKYVYQDASFVEYGYGATQVTIR